MKFSFHNGVLIILFFVVMSFQLVLAQPLYQIEPLYIVQPGAGKGGGATPYATLTPEEVTLYKYKNQPGEWGRIYLVAKDPPGCSYEKTGPTTHKIDMFLSIPSGFEVRYSSEKTIFYRESASSKLWANFDEVLSYCNCDDREGYYARDWFEIRPLAEVREGTYTLKLDWIAHYTDENGVDRTTSDTSVVKINVVELISPELKNSASREIEEAKDSIRLAEAYIASNSANADLSPATLLLNQAKDYLDDAIRYFDSKEFELAKSKAERAKSLAEEARSTAEKVVKKAEEERSRTTLYYTAIAVIAILVVAISVAMLWRKKFRSKER